jgi:DNA polymerase I-like protein with 3'-5' exonuclease and polymerase domains
MKTLYDLYHEYVFELDPILYEAGRVNGVHIHVERQRALRSKIEGEIAELITQAQDFVPQELKPRTRYKKSPPEGSLALPVMVEKEVKTCSVCGVQGIKKGEHITKGGKKNPCHDATVILTPGLVQEWDVIEDFNPLSGPQLKAYALHYRHPLGRNHKTKSGTTLDDKQLRKLYQKFGTKHPLYTLVRTMRGRNKVLSTYVVAFEPDETGRIYGDYTHNPETFRLSQKNVNLTNVPHRGDKIYAAEVRQTIIPPEGYVFVEADSSSVEAVMTGHFMGSKKYMEMAKKGIHALWACIDLGLEPTPENIKFVKNAKEHGLLYARKKKTVHGVSYGEGAFNLFQNNDEIFTSSADAQREIDRFYEFAPELQSWHKEIRDYGFRHGHLQSPWGLKNYFYQVYRKEWSEKKQKWVWVLGEDANAIIAYLPQHSNAMFQRGNILRIAKRKPKKFLFPANMHVHDSNLLAVPEDRWEEAANLLAEVMTRPIPELGGLQIGVDVKVGKNWDDYDPDENPEGMKKMKSVVI